MRRKSAKKKTILIICGYAVRELETLLVLKKTLSEQTGARVVIVGGISELQRMYYYLYKYQPELVILSQVLEKACRQMSQYVLGSGGLVYIVPAEITIIKIIENILLSPKLQYNSLVSRYLLPGVRYQKLLDRTDVSPQKIAVVGSPKIDVLVRAEGKQFWSRKKFRERYYLPANKKLVWIFTSFVVANENYLRSDHCFDSSIDALLESNRCIAQTKKQYLASIQQLAHEFPDHIFLVKPHPLEEIKSFQSLQADNLHIITDVPFASCIKSVDLAVHWSSTIAAECWIQHIPTVQYAPFPEYDTFLAESSVGNPIVRTYAQLAAAIGTYLKKELPAQYRKKQTEYLSENFFKLDGKASTRIAAYAAADLTEMRAPQYQPRFSFYFVGVLLLETLIGYEAVQQLLGSILPEYYWKVAVANRVHIE